MNGTVSGGWEFVWSAYLITICILGAYTARAFVIHREASRRHTRE
jgi:hypothetical protein